ncbi:DUF3857 domain-containing protein [Aureitalea marina]|uniref:DUF3857 domain-containing protein n=1 Tax=Aureitalea marina TaxID=930804 RepID=A0A2S7KTE7_9FLAO|nr:DUF3857 domain-containing protein [Aureitalea marina]PQB05901.1 hypothetical protein BST85_01125 [Aureitalea marina]
MRKHLLLMALLVALPSKAQSDFIVALLDPVLKEKSNSVLLYENTLIDIPNQNSITIRTQRKMMVLNKAGMSDLKAFVHYDDSRKVKVAEAIVYDALGKEIERFRRKDFLDMSAVDGGTLYSDDRVMVMNYSPKSYPFSVEFVFEVVSDNTAFIPPWYLHTSYYSSIKNKSLEIRYQQELELRNKVHDPDGVMNITEQPGLFKIAVEQIPSIEPEPYGPILEEMVPNVKFAMTRFNLEGIRGEAGDWSAFGAWEYENLLKGLDELPDDTRQKIAQLIADAPSEKEKVKRIYQYVQDNTRYISVQLGIGGLRPYPASEVQEMGYGDCKGLTNYTMALLKLAGIKAYYAEVYAGPEKRDIDPEFASIQGNHVILNVPLEEEEIWLECTSQTMPFNFLGDFTDDRNVLLLTPEGGIMKRTPKYSEADNVLVTKGESYLAADGGLQGAVSMSATGIQYDSRQGIERLDMEDKIKMYKRYWGYINNLSLQDIQVENNRDSIQFSEDMKVAVRDYGSFAGDKMIVPLNSFNRYTNSPKRDKDRQQDVVRDRGFLDIDEFVLHLPEGYKIESVPNDISEKTTYGIYETSVEVSEDGGIVTFRRKFQLNQGKYPAAEYNAYRSFIRKVARGDNQKMVLIPN